jgi:integrase/recombinase XerD
LPKRIDLGKAPQEILSLSNEEIMEEFLLTLESAGASEDTVKAYRAAIKDFLEFINEKPLRNISLRDIIAWRNNRLRNGFKKMRSRDKKGWQTTLHYYTLFLNRFFEWLGINIKIPRMRKPPRKITVLNDDEVAKLLKSISDPLDKLILSILLDTGLRSRELLSIRVSDIDLESRTITVTETKYGRERKVIITSKTADLIKAWIELNDLEKDDKLIPLTYSGLYKRIKRIGRRAGIPLRRIRPHILRHTFATQALRKGLPLPYLQIILGHQDIKTTQVYLHLTIDDIRKKYEEVMDNKIRSTGVVKCPNCGRIIPSNANYCPYCGYKIRKEILLATT